MFVKQGTDCSRYCSCSYSASPNFQLTDVDITLCVTLIKNCYYNVLTQQEEKELDEIRLMRNEIAHYPHNVDLTESKFNTMWTQINNAVIHLSSCISQRYNHDIQDKILRLRSRPIVAEEVLHQTCKWKFEYDESMKEKLDRLENKVDTLIIANGPEVMEANCIEIPDDTPEIVTQAVHGSSVSQSVDDWSGIAVSPAVNSYISQTESELPVSRTSKNSIVAKQYGTRTCLIRDISDVQTADHTSLDDNEKRYFRTFNEIERMRKSESNSDKEALMYCLLVYVVLKGNTSEENLDWTVLSSIHNDLYNCPIRQLHSMLCLAELSRKYLENKDGSFSVCNQDIVEAVISSFGNVSPECLVENCTSNILLRYVRPIGGNYTDFHIGIDVGILVFALIQRFSQGSDAVNIGIYMGKLILSLKGTETAHLFLDALEQTNDSIKAEHMIFFLIGLTNNGEDYEVFEKMTRLYDTFSCQVDRFGNTVFHYMVVQFDEQSEIYGLLIEYFCENKIQVMQLENRDGHSAILFAAYCGRSQVIANVMCNITGEHSLTEEILVMVNKAIESLNIINSNKKRAKQLSISLEEYKLGKGNDYEKILEIIGIHDVEPELVKDTNTKGNSTRESSSDSDDVSKLVGDKVLGMVKDVKKGVKAIKKIPNLIKTIHQATMSDDDDDSD